MTLLKYAYIDFPGNVNLLINDIALATPQNPFSTIIQYVIEDDSLALKGQGENYRYWIITQEKLIEIEQKHQIVEKFEGVLIYKNNEFVRKDEVT